jgi:hypothetical protein
MTAGNGSRRRGGRRSDKENRAVVVAALKHSKQVNRKSFEALARLMGPNEKTIRRWLDDEEKAWPTLKALMRNPNVWRHFLRCFVGVERKDHRI